ncbi:MAG: nitrogenase cofactor biosynthesis protein NifB [Thermoplasmata archaeon]|nr:nitrogenase cofactor biosynthesis protein NifB [Thermoplasmata archaeon]
MSLDPRIKDALATHPCYNEEAHRKFARMHVPVAPRCNIQCNFCNRKFDCCNESRPGVTSEVLTPEQAVEKIRLVKEKVPNLSVIGIAGPGDPLANEETFRTLELVGREFPELTLCVSTNGLALPDCADRLHSLGVRFLTVTMNAPDPETGAKIYDSVVFRGERLTGEEGAMTLLYRQVEGIKRCVELGMAVKVNVVMIPGINDSEIPALVKRVKALGVYMVNILPLIPVEGTKFADLRAPTPAERKEMMDLCELDAKMMRHCRQCRADAIGLLGEDRSAEFVNLAGCGGGCGGRETVKMDADETLVAVATSDGRSVGGFGSASSFRIFATDGGTCRFLREVPVDRSAPVSGDSHRAHIDRIVSSIQGCGTVVVSEIGEMPSRVLRDAGIRIVRAKGDVNEAVRSSRRRDPSARSAGPAS